MHARHMCNVSSTLTLHAFCGVAAQPLRAYADLKIGRPLERYSEILRTDVELNLKVEARSRHDTEHLGKEAHIAEVTAYCKDKHVIHCTATNENMYASLDELTDTLSRKLRKWKGNRMHRSPPARQTLHLLHTLRGVSEDKNHVGGT